MKKSLPAICILLGMMHPSQASETLLEDDFTQGDSGDIADRQPLVGNPWQGMAGVVDGAGMVHGGEIGTRSAIAQLDVPADAGQVTASIKGIFGGNSQFRFGFTNNPTDILGEGENNRGLVWAYLAGSQIFVFGGEYGRGDSLQATVRDLRSGAPFDLEITAKIVTDGEPVPVSVSFNGKQAIAGELATTQHPTLENFFIQFQGGIDAVSDTTVIEVKVVAE